MQAITYYEYVTRVLPVVNDLFHSTTKGSDALESKEEHGEETKATTEREGVNEGEIGGREAGGGGDSSRGGSGGMAIDNRGGISDATGLGQVSKLAGIWTASETNTPGNVEKLDDGDLEIGRAHV